MIQPDRLEQAIRQAQQLLLSRQHQEEGYWVGQLEANVSITAEYLMLYHYLGLIDPQRERRAVDYILSQQLPDGSWPIYYGGPGDLSLTVEAYVALKLAGLAVEHEGMKRARDFIRAQGGVERSRVFTKIHLALLGLYPWEGVPHIPPEIIFLPKNFPLSIYQMASWARSCVVPLSIIMAYHPVYRSRPDLDIDEIRSGERPGDRGGEKRGWLSIDRLFLYLDRLLKVYNRYHLQGLRKRAIRAAERWILEHQEESGDWGGIIPAMLYSLLALLTLGYRRDDPVIVRGIEAIERFTVRDGDLLWLQSCVSPVWDTAWNVYVLSQSGIAGDHPCLVRAARWLLARQVLTYGDWSVLNKKARPGGWSFEFYNTFYPDIDDTCVVMLALKEVSLPGVEEGHKEAAIERACAWVLDMQGRDGGFGAFDKDNNKEILNRIPFADHKAMLDKSVPDLTGRVLETLGRLGFGMDHPVAAKAIRFLRRHQEGDGSWYGRWGVNYIYGTWSALAGLKAIGLDRDAPEMRRGAAWLKRVQNADGGWGESCHSYVDPSFKGRGKSTPSQTAWALLGLMAAGEGDSEEVERGIGFLLQTQKGDGGWEEREYTGTGFPGHFYLNYQMYRYYFPLLALAKYRKMVG